MENLFSDLRFGARMLLKKPGFALIAIITLALGIGVNTTIFSVINGILIRQLPYPESERIMFCSWRFNEGQTAPVGVTDTQYEFFRDHSRSFQQVAAYADAGNGFNLVGGIEPVRVRGVRVSESFFSLLRVNPRMGRGFLAEEDQPNGPSVVVLTDGLWRGYFGADPDILGKQIQLNGSSATVVGVMPPDFHFETSVDLIVPLQMKADVRNQGHNTEMIARLKPDVPISQAQAEMDHLLPELRRAYPDHTGPNEAGIRLIPYQQYVIGDISNVLLLLFGAVALVLLIACANVANLLLARASSRNGEMAIRAALGAGKWRLVRQMMTENMMLAFLGGGVGLLAALWGLPVLLAITPEELPRLGEIGIDRHAILFALGASVLTSLLFGIFPALRAARFDINESLKSSSSRHGAGKRDLRMRKLLVVSEVALAVVLLIGAALLINSFTRLRAVDIGFDPKNLTALQVSLTSARYNTTADAWRFQEQALERISALPGVKSAAVSSSLPLERGLNMYINVERDGQQTGSVVEARPVSHQYFETLGISLMRGRALAETDSQASSPVVVINETLARRYWKDSDPVGESVSIGGMNWQIIGVVNDVKDRGLDIPVTSTIYIHTPQAPDGLTRSMNRWFLSSWIVRTEGRVDLSAALRDSVRQTDPQMPVASVRPMSQVLTGSISSEQFMMLLMGIFAGLALLLTSIGIYGVLSYQVSQRTNEIGIRIALGASRRDVLKLIVKQGMALAAIGIAIGIGAAFALTRLIESFLFGVSPTDPITFAGVSLLLALVAFAACYIPARRATKVDPMVALRYE